LSYEGILGLKLTKYIKQEKSVVLPVGIFGRVIIFSLLPSSSGAANISLSNSIGYNSSYFFNSQSTKPVYDYKVSLYNKLLK